MTIVERPSQTTPERVPTFDVTGWVLRISAAVLYVGVGLTKFESHSMWVRLFAEIELGDWFRYLTGAIQVAGGLLFFIPRTTYAAAALTGCTMAGAVVVNIFVLDNGIVGAIIPLGLLIFVAVVATRRPE